MLESCSWATEVFPSIQGKKELISRESEGNEPSAPRFRRSRLAAAVWYLGQKQLGGLMPGEHCRHLTGWSGPDSRPLQRLACSPQAACAVRRLAPATRCALGGRHSNLTAPLHFSFLGFISITVKMLLKFHQCEVQVPGGPTLTLGWPPNLPGVEIFLLLLHNMPFQNSSIQTAEEPLLPLSFAHQGIPLGPQLEQPLKSAYTAQPSQSEDS